MFSWDFLTFSWYHQNITKAYSLVSIGYSIVVFSTKFIQILFSKYLLLSLSTYLQFDSAHHDLSMTITWILLWSNTNPISNPDFNWLTPVIRLVICPIICPVIRPVICPVIRPVICPVIWCFPIWLTSTLSYQDADLWYEWNSDIFLEFLMFNRKVCFKHRMD